MNRLCIFVALLLVPTLADAGNYVGRDRNGARYKAYTHGSWGVAGNSYGERLAWRKHGRTTYWSNGYNRGVWFEPQETLPMKPWIMRK